MRKGPSAAVTAITVLAYGLAGCESKPVEYMPTPPAIEWAAPAETTVIDLDEFARRPLQPEVQRWIGSTVLIRTSAGVLSGQKVGPREVISAGHAFQHDVITKRLRACDVEIVDDARDGNAGKSYTSGTIGGARYGYDFVNISLADTEPNLPAPYVSLADVTKIKRGDEVAIVGYQPTSEGDARDPASTDPSLREPEVIRSVVLGIEGARIALLTGLKGGGSVIPGQSGGSGLVAGGTLGVVSGWVGGLSSDEIERRYGVDFIGEVPYRPEIVYLQAANEPTRQLARSNPAQTTGC